MVYSPSIEMVSLKEAPAGGVARRRARDGAKCDKNLCLDVT